MADGKPLENKVAIVTGAGQGNGRAIALRLASDGAAVFGTDLRTDLLGELEDAGRESGLQLATGVYDAKRGRCGQAGCDVVESYGRLDVMVNNAGAIWTTPFPDVTEEIWDRTMDLNLKGLYFHMQAAARQMIEQRSGVMHQPGFHSRDDPGITLIACPYAASGSGDQPDQVGRIQGHMHGVRVNAVAPGIVDNVVQPDAVTGCWPCGARGASGRRVAAQARVRRPPGARLGTRRCRRRSLPGRPFAYITGETITSYGRHGDEVASPPSATRRAESGHGHGSWVRG